MPTLSTKYVFLDFFNFLKKPNDQQIESSTKEKILILFKFLFFELLITCIIVFPLDYIIDKFITLKSESLDYQQNTIYMVFILVVILVPFFEEVIFRSVLRYNSIYKGRISCEKWNRVFPYLVYTLCIAFGLVHAGNYFNESITFFLLSPLIVLSQLSGAFVISYIRVRLNFYYGFFYHALWNFVAAILIPSVMILFASPYVDKITNYTLSIEEKVFFHLNETQTTSLDIRDHKIYKIEATQLYLQDILDLIYGKGKFYVDEYIVNMKFSSKRGLTKEEFKKVLEKEYEIQNSSE
ncbi:CPBP family intramembrane glutamic endopeptidase [Chryseobacterium luquanense]|uniref:CPBP family intramembrane metalloprotease n=1 Tax=Chryseobacterium luquanense TaxID=2983766 RepID=A0ABT3Y727_9FLAO|nr:CPBP family intramembrane glutamic endopeptidase [Chryseobacterium luquanense]MCX8533949.1 CPBP family intramembrane metalloprotease [Chryseobacterium luquanense]